MTMRSKVGAGLLGVAAMIAAGALPLVAQEPGAQSEEVSPARKPSPQARRVPPFFGQVGLTPDQKEEIYRIKDRHLSKIEALKQQLAEAESQMMVDCEAVLTEAQRKLLEQRRGAGRGRSRSGAAGSNP